MTDNELYSMFITVGQIVSAKIMRDKSSGYSYGYGFVHYQQPEDAAKAIASLNGLQVIFTTLMTTFCFDLLCRSLTRGSRFLTADPTQQISKTQIFMLGTFHRWDQDHKLHICDLESELQFGNLAWCHCWALSSF